MTTTPDRDLTIDEKLALDAAGLDMDLDLMRTAGLALGGMMGRVAAARAVFMQAITDAIDGEAAYAAGLFRADEAPKRPTVVVLCGSTRFRDEFQAENRRLTLAGCIVLAPGVFGHAGDPAPTEAEKEALDELHFRKIDLSDRVVVINPGGYVGDSTRREIDYAISCGKVISWLEGREDTPEALAETHDAYGTPVTPPVNPPPFSGDKFCQPCGDVFGPLHACFEDEPGQEGAEAENDPAFAETPAPTAWCGDPDHDDPCDRCDEALVEASEALRQRMPGGEQ